MKFRIATLAALLSATFFVFGAQAVVLTSVDQLDLANVVKAYNFTNGADGTLAIGGVTFTTHNWANQLAFDGLTVTDPQGMSGAPLGAPAITSGGTPADQANLSSLLNSTNFSGGSSPGAAMTLSIAIPDGNYLVQYLAGTSANRSNEFFNVGPPAESLGTFNGSGNFLLTGLVTATGGTGLTLSVDHFAGSDGRPIISGLIVNEIFAPVPEPSSVLLLGLGALGLACRTRRRGREQAGR